MTRRDLKWRLGGFFLFSGGGASCLALDGAPVSLLIYPLALLGLPLMIHGKRVGQVLGALRHDHDSTIDALHAARSRPKTP